MFLRVHRKFYKVCRVNRMFLTSCGDIFQSAYGVLSEQGSFFKSEHKVLNSAQGVFFKNAG